MNNIFKYLKPAKKDTELLESIMAKHSLNKDLDYLWTRVQAMITGYYIISMQTKEEKPL